MNISPFQILSPTTFSTGVQTFLKKLHSRRVVISHLHYTGEEAVAQRGEVTSLRSHSTLLSGAGQEPRAPPTLVNVMLPPTDQHPDWIWLR